MVKVTVTMAIVFFYFMVMAAGVDINIDVIGNSYNVQYLARMLLYRLYINLEGGRMKISRG